MWACFSPPLQYLFQICHMCSQGFVSDHDIVQRTPLRYMWPFPGMKLLLIILPDVAFFVLHRNHNYISHRFVRHGCPVWIRFAVVKVA